MTVFVDQGGTPASVFSDFFAICGCDGGLGENNGPNSTIALLTFAKQTASITADRVDALVNTAFANPIVVSGLSTNAALALGVSGGATLLDTNTTPATVRVIYDTGQCNGQGWWAVDTGNNHIPIPNDVILYHELAHAFQFLTTAVTGDEVTARTDENDERTRDGLPHRDVNNGAIGCGIVFAVGGGSCPSSSSTGGSCFIASAAYGSSLAPQVQMLRAARDVVLRNTRWGDTLFSELFRQYYRFSPQVARDMVGSPRLRSQLELLVVAPVVDFFGLVSDYANGGWADRRFADDALAHLRGMHGRLLMAGVDRDTAHILSVALPTFARELRTRAGGSRSDFDGEMPPQTLPDAIAYLFASVRGSPGSFDELSWALLRPLAAYWRGLSRLGADGADGASASGTRLVRDIRRWLAAVPLETLAPTLDEPSLRKDLTDLASGVFTDPEVRNVVGARIAARYAEVVPYDLRTSLRSCGYLAFDRGAPCPIS